MNNKTFKIETSDVDDEAPDEHKDTKGPPCGAQGRLRPPRGWEVGDRELGGPGGTK